MITWIIWREDAIKGAISISDSMLKDVEDKIK